MEYQYELSKDRLKKEVLEKLVSWLESRNFEVVELSDKVIIKGEDFYFFYRFENVVRALEIGFDLEDAKNIVLSDWELLEIDVKKAANRDISHYRRIASRIIGESGKFIRYIEKISGARMILKDKKLYILGDRISSYSAYEGMKRLISGTPHSKIEDIIHRTKRHLKNKDKEAEYRLNF